MSRTQTTNYQADPVGAVGGSTVFEWASSGDDYFSRTKDLANLALALERHTHAADRGLAVQRVAPGSINTDAIVLNPIFPGTVTVVGGFNVTTGNAIFSHNVQISGTLNVAGATTISSGSSLSFVGGGAIVGAGNIAGTGLSLSAPGTISTPGSLSVGTTGAFGGAITVTGTATITSNIFSTGGFISAATGLITTAGGLVVGAGNVSFGDGGHPSNLSVFGTINSTGKLNVTAAAGASISGTVDLLNNLTVWGNAGFLGNVGVTGNLTPAVNLGSNLGDPSVQWATLFANHLTITGTCSFQTGITVASGFINAVNLTLTGALSVGGGSGFAGTITPAVDNTANNGFTGVRWIAVYAVNGTIQTSSREMKEHLTPLDTKLALRVALDTKLHEFQYRSSDDEGNLQSRKTAKPRRERQVGFVADEAHPLLLVAEDGVNAQNTASVALGAIQELHALVESLTARLENLEGPKH